jgi:hypothetical protein
VRVGKVTQRPNDVFLGLVVELDYLPLCDPAIADSLIDVRPVLLTACEHLRNCLGFFCSQDCSRTCRFTKPACTSASSMPLAPVLWLA